MLVDVPCCRADLFSCLATDTAWCQRRYRLNLFEDQPPLVFHFPRKWCSTEMPGESGSIPSRPTGCTPQCTLGRMRTVQGSSVCMNIQCRSALVLPDEMRAAAAVATAAAAVSQGCSAVSIGGVSSKAIYAWAQVGVMYAEL